MRGFVRVLNMTNGLVAVETKDGFTVFELLEPCAVDFGDQLDGPLDSAGQEILHNITKAEDFAVSIKYVHCRLADVYRLLA